MDKIPTAESIYEALDVIPTGLFIDNLTGISGLPRGRMTVLTGQPSVGKSTLSLIAIREAQKLGLKPLLYDVEFSFDPNYAKNLGVDIKKLWVIQERFAEDGLDRIEAALETGEFGLVVVDSIGALLPRTEAEKNYGERTIGAQAGLVAKFVRKAIPIIAIKNIALICLTHEFQDIMSGTVKPSGGAKLVFHSSLTIQLKYKGVYLKSGDKKVGKVIHAVIKKNRLASTEGAEMSSNFVFGTGFSATSDLLQIAIDKNIIQKRKTSYFFGETKLGVGLQQARKTLEGDEELLTKIKEKLD